MSVAKDDAGKFAAAMNRPSAPSSLFEAAGFAERSYPMFHSYSAPSETPYSLTEATFIFGGNRDAWEVYRTVQDFWAVRRFGS